MNEINEIFDEACNRFPKTIEKLEDDVNPTN